MRRHGKRGAWLGLGLGVVLAGACFDAPRPAVQFSCDPVDAPQCPAGYTCEADGCCHLDGSDYAEHAGRCQLGGGLVPGTTGESTSTSSGMGSETGSETGSDGTSGTDAPTGDSGSTAGTDGSGTTAGTDGSGTTAGASSTM